MATAMSVSAEDLAQWRTDGFLVLRGLWSRDEIAACAERFAEITADGQPIPGHWDPDPDSDDPLLRCPRIMHPHRFDELAMRMLLDARIEAVLAALLGEEPIAAQSMFYFKPPGSKGQGPAPGQLLPARAARHLHRGVDGRGPLRPRERRPVRLPGHAHDGGGMPGGSRRGGELHHPLRPSPRPGGAGACRARPGGRAGSSAAASCTAHGRTPPAHEWRRSFICHYLPVSSRELSRYYRPTLRFDGSEYDFADAGARRPVRHCVSRRPGARPVGGGTAPRAAPGGGRKRPRVVAGSAASAPEK